MAAFSAHSGRALTEARLRNYLPPRHRLTECVDQAIALVAQRYDGTELVVRDADRAACAANLARRLVAYLGHAGDAVGLGTRAFLASVGRGEAYAGRPRWMVDEAVTAAGEAARGELLRVEARDGRNNEALLRLDRRIIQFVDAGRQAVLGGYDDGWTPRDSSASAWSRRLTRAVLFGGCASAGLLRRHGEFALIGDEALTTALVIQPSDLLCRATEADLPAGVIGDFDQRFPVALLSGRGRPETVRSVRDLFPDCRVAIGIPTALSDTPAAVKWGQRCLRLGLTGAVPATDVVYCADHVAALWTHSEPALAMAVERDRLSALLSEPPYSCRIVAETFLCWYAHGRPGAPTLARLLDRHPQTVRYRLRRMRHLLGPAIDDPVLCHEIFLTLSVLAYARVV